MPLVPDHIRVLYYLFLAAYMLSVGLETTRGQIVTYLRDSRLTAPTLLANLVLVPILGLILTQVIHLQPDIRTGLLLLAIAPGGLFALNFARVSKGNIELAVGQLLLLTLLAFLVTPVSAHFFLGAGGSFGRIFRLTCLLLLLILVPIFVGRMISSFVKPAVAKRMGGLIGNLSIVLFVIFNLLSSGIKKPAMKSIGSGGLAIIILLVIISWVIGWFLGGSEVRNKKVMAISTSMRNVIVCLPLAINEFPGRNVIVPILAFSSISITMNFLFATVTKLSSAIGLSPTNLRK